MLFYVDNTGLVFLINNALVAIIIIWEAPGVFSRQLKKIFPH